MTTRKRPSWQAEPDPRPTRIWTNDVRQPSPYFYYEVMFVQPSSTWTSASNQNYYYPGGGVCSPISCSPQRSDMIMKGTEV